ncbi:MAG: family 16 glycosylhydrolase [Bacteroidia bacterium]
MSKISTIVLSLCLLGFNSCEQSDPIQKEYTLIWSDEFDKSELDETKWEYQLGDGSEYGLWRWGNNEDQYYRKENVSIANGVLRIKSIREDIKNYQFTSARIRTLEKLDFKYGKVEASIKMANTGGLWHALWMLPSHPTNPWPVSGEIDIMEYVGNAPNEILNTIHFADAFGNHNQLGEPEAIVVDNNFHTYAIEWDENKIVWFRDSTETYRVLRTAETINKTWPFDAEFHLLLNTAVGGNLGGAIDVQELQKAKYMEVDYVRVYQKN